VGRPFLPSWRPGSVCCRPLRRRGSVASTWIGGRRSLPPPFGPCSCFLLMFALVRLAWSRWPVGPIVEALHSPTARVNPSPDSACSVAWLARPPAQTDEGFALSTGQAQGHLSVSPRIGTVGSACSAATEEGCSSAFLRGNVAALEAA
jgi:hypothetical protein